MSATIGKGMELQRLTFSCIDSPSRYKHGLKENQGHREDGYPCLQSPWHIAPAPTYVPSKGAKLQLGKLGHLVYCNGGKEEVGHRNR
jgi:hypothetical protein